MKRLFAGSKCFKMQLAGVLALLVLAACHKKTPVRVQQSTLPCKVYGASDEAIIKLQYGFNQRGIKAISTGQNYLLSIPSHKLFYNETPRLIWASHALLNEVACYLKQFRQVAVTITAFSNKCVSWQREKALTLARARAVGDYLWSQGIDSRFLFTAGLGSDKPIIHYSGGGDASPNSRIEITFRRAVA